MEGINMMLHTQFFMFVDFYLQDYFPSNNVSVNRGLPQVCTAPLLWGFFLKLCVGMFSPHMLRVVNA